jgi:hypothetical protein
MLTMLPIESVVPSEDDLRRQVGDVRDLTASVAALPKTDVQALVAPQLLGDLSATHAKTACRILEIDALEGQWGTITEAPSTRSPRGRRRTPADTNSTRRHPVFKSGTESPLPEGADRSRGNGRRTSH